MTDLLGTGDPAKQIDAARQLKALAETSSITVVLQLNRATGRMVIVPIAVNITADDCLRIMDMARTEIVRAQVEAEARKAQEAAKPEQGKDSKSI